MKIETNSYASVNFGIKVSPKFISAAKAMISSGDNRLKNNYRFDKKIEDFGHLGYDNYTIELNKQYKSDGTKYIFSAVNNADKNDQIFLGSCYSFKKSVENFMNMTHSSFNNRMRKNVQINK